MSAAVPYMVLQTHLWCHIAHSGVPRAARCCPKLDPGQLWLQLLQPPGSQGWLRGPAWLLGPASPTPLGVICCAPGCAWHRHSPGANSKQQHKVCHCFVSPGDQTSILVKTRPLWTNFWGLLLKTSFSF